MSTTNPGQRMPLNIPIGKIELVENLQIRTKIDEKTVEEYVQVLRDGGELDPVELFVDSDGKKLLGDGWHRVMAYQSVGRATVPAYQDEDHPKEAYENALRSALKNTKHGLKCSQEDKRRAVALALQQWPKAASDRTISRLCAVSPALVAKIRENGFTKNKPRTKKENPDETVNTTPPKKKVTVTEPQEIEPVGSLPEVEAAREGLRGNAAPGNPNEARVKQVKQWVEAGFLDFPDIREIFETEKATPVMLPRNAPYVLLVVKGRNNIELPVSGMRVKDGVLEVAVTAEDMEKTYRPVEAVA